MTLAFAVDAVVTRADVASLCAGLAVVLEGGGETGDVVCDVAAVVRPDVVTVELLTRLALVARRHGRRLLITGANPELVRLTDRLGLGDTLRLDR